MVERRDGFETSIENNPFTELFPEAVHCEECDMFTKGEDELEKAEWLRES
jgi:hypothetical protein